MFRAAAWCAVGLAATRRRLPACLDKNDRERVLIRRISEDSCATRVASSAQFSAADSFRRRHISRSRSRLLSIETFPNRRVPRHRDGKEQNRRQFFEPKSGRNKKEQLRMPARRDFASVGPNLSLS